MDHPDRKLLYYGGWYKKNIDFWIDDSRGAKFFQVIGIFFVWQTNNLNEIARWKIKIKTK